jgi:isoleucyl-tRNA synthetase
MDVWFDSGSSWSGVLNSRGLSFPADLYLEGSDQHRGWFQSSLLTSVAVTGRAPFKHVLTHGFVLDEKGAKMSKSVGNVVDPLHIIEGGANKKLNPAYGADVLRLWVASVDYTTDVCIGDNIIKQVFESYRRIRNTARYMLGNLNDFDDANILPYDSLASMDKYILGRYSSVAAEVKNAYENFHFFRASQSILKFVSTDLSSFYLDVAKDWLYVSARNDSRRRSCQTVLKIIVEGLAKMMAPLLPHMAEDVWLHLPYKPESISVFQGGWSKGYFQPHRENEWQRIMELRGDVNKCIELARTQKVVGSSLECEVRIHSDDPEMCELLAEFGEVELEKSTGNEVDNLRVILIASSVLVLPSVDEVSHGCAGCTLDASVTQSGCSIGVKRTPGLKCERCWMYSDFVGSGDYLAVCPRCSRAIMSWKAERSTG